MAPGGVSAVIAGLATAAVLSLAPSASAETVTLGPNSESTPFATWTVPVNVCSATFDLYGAEGSGHVGGARVTTTLPVKPGAVYYLVVGSWGLVGHGGFNGGGAATGNGVGGGGATDVRTGPSLAERILVAGGGGGNGGEGPGQGIGGGGGLVGANGTEALEGEDPGQGGGGGTATSGGAGARHATTGEPGALGHGGAGGPKGLGGGYGGGGGGGLYGGGGGGGGLNGAGGGGGGGSSLAAGGTVTTTSGGQGKAIINYAPSAACEKTGGGQPGGGQTGTGGQTVAAADNIKPSLSALIFAFPFFAAAKSGASLGPDTKNTPRTGSRVSFDLSETGMVAFTVDRRAAGRRLHGRCASPAQSAHGRRCTRWIPVNGSFSFPASAGKNTFVFRGRVGGRSLRPNHYRLNGKATDNAKNTSPVVRAAFTVVP